jgi:glycerophosphoryl diester phosphodiesterase
MSDGRPWVIGHRGASGYRPEHTRAAFELAFALGADAVEPDIVATRDGILVVRHENEISGTTDVASRSEFAGRRTTKEIDGTAVTGWFTEDFDWAELSTLRARERLPRIRQRSASFDGRFGIVRLSDLLHVIDRAIDVHRRPLSMVAEIKHATYFESIGLPLDELFAAEVAGWATADNLVVESFEQSVLGKVRGRGIPGPIVYLLERAGAAADLVASDGRRARTYAQQLTPAGLAALATEVDGISVDKALLIDKWGDTSDLVNRAHSAGLTVFTWTLRAENRFLVEANRTADALSDFGNWFDEFRTLIDLGLDGVFADQPDLVVDVLRDGAPA